MPSKRSRSNAAHGLALLGCELHAQNRALSGFGISPEGIGTVGMLVNFAIAITVSRFTPEPPAEVQDLADRIRIPKKAG